MLGNSELELSEIPKEYLVRPYKKAGLHNSTYEGKSSAYISLPNSDARWQGLTLVHFSAQPEPFLTQNTP